MGMGAPNDVYLPREGQNSNMANGSIFSMFHVRFYVHEMDVKSDCKHR